LDPHFNCFIQMLLHLLLAGLASAQLAAVAHKADAETSETSVGFGAIPSNINWVWSEKYQCEMTMTGCGWSAPCPFGAATQAGTESSDCWWGQAKTVCCKLGSEKTCDAECCAEWGCSCGGFKKTFGTVEGQTWGKAESSLLKQRWWTSQDCDSHPNSGPVGASASDAETSETSVAMGELYKFVTSDNIDWEWSEKFQCMASISSCSYGAPCPGSGLTKWAGTVNDACWFGTKQTVCCKLGSKETSAVSYTLLHSGGECKSGDDSLGNQDSVEACAKTVRKYGGTWFIYGTGGKANRCYIEHTSSDSCPEGFESDSYDFYRADRADTITFTTDGTNTDSVIFKGFALLGLGFLFYGAGSYYFRKETSYVEILNEA